MSEVEREGEAKHTMEDSPPRGKKQRLVSESSSAGDGAHPTADGDCNDNDSNGKEEQDDAGSASGSDSEDDDGSNSDSDDSSASIEDEELSGLLWPTRDGVKHADPQEQMQALVQDMMAMREENAELLEQHVERLKKRKAPAT